MVQVYHRPGACDSWQTGTRGLDFGGYPCNDTHIDERQAMRNTDAIKQQAMIEALEFYINNLKEINANQAAIDLFTEVLGDVEEEIW